MKRTAAPLLGLALLSCIICAGCSMSSNPGGGSLMIGTPSMPDGTVGTAYSYSVPASGGTPPYVWSLNSGTLPVGLKLSSKGVISGTPQSPGTTSFSLAVIDSEAVPASATANFSISVQSELAVTSLSPPAGTVGVSYSASLAAAGGVPPYSWTLLGGSLPPGLSLSTAGLISGTPTASGNFIANVQVADIESPSQTATAQLTIAVNTITITTQSLPAATVNVPYSAPLTAIGGVAPYTWTLSGALPAGLALNCAGVITGTPTAAGNSSFSVQVADSEAPPATAAAPLSILVNSRGSSSALQGSYAFYLNGFNSAAAWTLAGSFIADGSGNIVSGVVDSNSIAGEVNAAITGTYTATGTGVNTITLQAPSWGPMTLVYVLDSNGNGRVIEYDDTTGQGSRGSGVLRQANPSAFSLGALAANWAFGLTGAGQATERYVEAGRFTTATANISAGVCAINDGGYYQTCTFTGTLAAVDPQTGRTTAALQTGDAISHWAVYVVSSSELAMEQIDAATGGNPLLAGSALAQQGSFGDASLNGTAVLYLQAVHQQDGLDQSIAGLISFDGGGAANVLAMDENLAGVITQDQPSQGTYSVDATGAVTMTCGANCPTGFLVTQNHGFFVGTGAGTTFGVMEPQSGGPFSNASLAGSYSGGSLPPLDYTNATNHAETGSADGLGTLTLSGNASGWGGLTHISGNLIYNIAANGRGTAQGQTELLPGIVYMISPSHWIILQPSSDARVNVYQH